MPSIIKQHDYQPTEAVTPCGTRSIPSVKITVLDIMPSAKNQEPKEKVDVGTVEALIRTMEGTRHTMVDGELVVASVWTEGGGGA